ncbi:MAG TPA: nickel pincer cofactor biosynthesis protein LarC [Nocardioides sp.]|uniref:nickel pincer cofactor biosynthesis protein LarC n=1 Tax=Nocardioides sp. TaxID=35761 RepID=UPI002E304AD4|nr:nickel pincer cofactor biosynthesis protein LarC [Nocardioides sp.]HEX5089035.1 nickel pincer cofactor biosynthesis protein LarC [Nocardioides sp.]
MTTLWVDASSGASGDMLLGALVGAGVSIEVPQRAVAAVSPELMTLRAEAVTRNGFAATRVHVDVADSAHHRTWRDIRRMLLESTLSDDIRDLALRVFERLAAAEGAVHGHDPLDVHFHEVGALDAIADVVGTCAGFAHLAPTEIVVSPIAVGSGTIRAAHGTLPVPPPAVAALLTGVPSYAGPESAPATELCTPTGAALLTTLATSYGPQPAMTTEQIGVGAGGRDPEGHANVLRLLVGSPVPAAGDADDLLVLETNVDDLDPRLWPDVITSVLAAGALDAWLTPIVMKKGRPAHTFRALASPDRAAEVRATIFRETTTIGVRAYPVARHALPRELATVSVDGFEIAVKLARLDGVVVTAQPEYEDVVRAAHALGRPVREVLARAQAAASSAAQEARHR